MRDRVRGDPDAVSAGGTSAMLARLSPRRREIIRPLLEEPREYALRSLRRMARDLGVDPATLLRIVQAMGFDHYHEFQKHLHDRAIAFSTSLDVLEQSSPKGNGVDALVASSVERDLDNLKQFRNSLDITHVVAIAKKLWAARRVLIMAGDMAISFAYYLNYNLAMLGINCTMAANPGEITHRVRHVNQQDVAIGISYGRGLRQTVDGMRQAKDNRAYCIAISDTFISPLSQYADQLFLTTTQRVSFADSMLREWRS